MIGWCAYSGNGVRRGSDFINMKNLILIFAASSGVFLSACQNCVEIVHDPKQKVWTIHPPKSNYTLEFSEENPNILTVKPQTSDPYVAWIITDEKGIKSVQLVDLYGNGQPDVPDITGAFVMGDKKVRRIKGIKTGILVRSDK